MCCATAEQCESLGLSPTDLRPCGADQACADDHTCVAAQCMTSDDCPAASPVCAEGLCVAACTADPDCPTALPHCDAGACVVCTESSQCPSDAAICDSATHACRGCTTDDECDSDVCIEDTGLCAGIGQIIYVGAYTPDGDTGSCNAIAPCASIAYALTLVTPTRNVIRLTDERASLGEMGTDYLRQFMVTVDGKPTMLSGPSIRAGGGYLSFENVTYAAAANTVVSDSEGSLTFARSMLTLSDASAISVSTSSTLTLRDTTVTGPGVNTHAIACDTGVLIYERSTFRGASSESTSCDEQISRSTFTDSKLRDFVSGHMQIKNSLVVSTAGDDDVVDTKDAGPGSYVRFVTFVNQSPVTQSQAALYCGVNVDVSSCLFSYNSRIPVDFCAPHDSLFDLESAPDPLVSGNDIEDAATFFAGTTDYHLAPSSPAIDHGEPGLVTDDLDGNPRDSKPDIGAYEAQ